MSELDPIEPLLTAAPRREPPITWQVAGSLAIHLGLLGLLLWPAVRTSLEALPPTPIEVELVAVEEQPSSVPPPSSATESASSEAPAAEQTASGEPSSTEAASSQPEPSSAEPSASEPPPSAQPSDAPSSAVEPPPSAPSQPEPVAESSGQIAPVPILRPVVVPVGSGDQPATDTSSAEGGGVAELTAETGDVAAGDTGGSGEGADSPAVLGELHVAQTFYLAEILNSASMANAREALKGLPHDKRVSQTCNIEAIGQVGNAGRGFTPDAVIAEAFSKATIAGTELTANGAIFRSEQKWYALAFDCTLNDALTEVTSFSYRLGPDVTEIVTTAQQPSG